MTWTCFLHEWRCLLRSRRLFGLFVATLLILGLTTLWSAETDRRQAEAQREAARKSREDWLDQGAVHPHRMAHFGDFVFRPSGLLARFDSGIQASTGRVIRVEAHRQNSPLHSSRRAAGALGRAGRFDPAFLLQVLGPLVLLLLGGTTAVAERESGRLRWLLGQGVRAWPILFGRFLMLWTVGLTMLVVVFLGVVLSDGGELLSSQGGRLLGLLGLYTIFYGVVASLSVTVGVVARSGSAALVLVLAAWVLGVAVLPRVTASIASKVGPLPTREAFEVAMAKAREKGLDGHNPRDKRMAKLQEEILKKYKVKSVKELPIDFGGIRMQADEEFGYKVWDEHYGQLREIFEEQGRVAQGMALINPFQLVQFSSMTLAGTDLSHELHFLHDVEHYRRELIGALNHEHAYGRPRRVQGNKASAEFFAGLDAYRHEPMPLEKALSSRIIEIGGLILWLIFGGLSMLFCARRLERRGTV